MSETTELFKDSKQKRSDNRESSAKILTDRGILFVSKNDGAHLIVTHKTIVADFWPGTGKWSIRGSGKYFRGVFNLLKALS